MNSMRFVTLACFKSYSIHMEVSWQNQNQFQTCGRVERRGCKRGKKAGKRTEGLDVCLGGDFLYLKGRKLCVISVWQGMVNPRKKHSQLYLILHRLLSTPWQYCCWKSKKGSNSDRRLGVRTKSFSF